MRHIVLQSLDNGKYLLSLNTFASDRFTAKDFKTVDQAMIFLENNDLVKEYNIVEYHT